MAERSSTLATSRGEARLVTAVPRAAGVVALLMHGAGGDSAAPVLRQVAHRLVTAGVGVVRLDQPYRVAGRRAPDPAARLDEVALEVVAHIRRRWPRPPLVLAGKSSGARVACRVAGSARADAVVALGFPLHPPGRPERSRAAELLGAPCPVLVVQGERDAFGTPEDVRAVVATASAEERARSDVLVHAVAGADHSFAARRADGRTTAECLDEVADAVVGWLGPLLGQAT